MDYRTKSTIEVGIKFSKPAGDAHLVEYQPGNGTRYQLLIVDTKSSPEANEALDFGESGGFVIAFPLGRYNTICLSRGGYLSRDYVAEKIGSRSESDVAVLTELLAYLTGRKADPAGPNGR